jgi:hypothetical protein
MKIITQGSYHVLECQLEPYPRGSHVLQNFIITLPRGFIYHITLAKLGSFKEYKTDQHWLLLTSLGLGWNDNLVVGSHLDRKWWMRLIISLFQVPMPSYLYDEEFLQYICCMNLWRMWQSFLGRFSQILAINQIWSTNLCNHPSICFFPTENQI